MKKIDDGIFVYESSVKLMPGVHFPLRSTFVELDKNELLVVSPGPFEKDEIKEFLSPYSKVHCFAPNAVHHFFLKRFYELFSNVSIYGPKSLIKKQPWLEGVLQEVEELKALLTEQVTFFPVLGNPFLDETVAFVQKRRTLVVTDLVFNMRKPMPLGRSLVLSLVGAKDRLAQSKLIERTMKDQASYRESLEPILKLEFDRVIVGHGNLIEGESEVAEFRKVLRCTQSR